MKPIKLEKPVKKTYTRWYDLECPCCGHLVSSWDTYCRECEQDLSDDDDDICELEMEKHTGNNK